MGRKAKWHIYQILNVKSGKVYIGSTVKGYRDRWCDHRRLLRKGSHHSPHLQNAWNTYGETSFEVKLIEELEITVRQNLLDREQYYIDLSKSYDPCFGYNINKTAYNRLGMVRTEESKRKQSLSKQRLSEDIVLEMMTKFWILGKGQKDIAKTYGMSKASVCLIVNGNTLYSKDLFSRFVDEHKIETTSRKKSMDFCTEEYKKSRYGNE